MSDDVFLTKGGIKEEEKFKQWMFDLFESEFVGMTDS
jgi:hypothetical protein